MRERHVDKKKSGKRTLRSRILERSGFGDKTLWDVLQLHARGALTLKTETYPLDDVNDVLSMLREGEITGRAVLVPGGREQT